MANAPDHDASRPVYAISVAAELVGTTVPTLRLYESHGLVHPERTAGGTRRYSQADLERVRRIAELVSSGVNLIGVGRVLSLEDDNAQLRTELDL